MAEKKFFVDINLQGNKLVNPVVGSNSSMTAEGSFQYNAGRLEYYNGSTVQEVANLNDIAAVTGGLILQGGYNPATNIPNIAGDASVLKGFFWVVTAAGEFLEQTVQVGDSIIAKQDNPGATAANWLILQGNVVIANETVDGIVRIATQEEVDEGSNGNAVVITPATLQGKINAQITPEINNKLPLAGGTMSGNIDMGDNNINGVNAINTNAITTTSGSGYLSLPDINISGVVDINENGISTSTIYTNQISAANGGGAPITSISPIDANGNSIYGLPTPSGAGDAANKTYVDDQDALKLSLTGGTMTGSINMNGAQLQNALIAEAILDSNLDANGLNINNLATPTNGGDATNKTYVDGVGATAESNANDYTNTAVSQEATNRDNAIKALSFTGNIEGSGGISGWTYDGVSEYYAYVTHNLDNKWNVVTTSIGEQVVEFNVQMDSPNTILLRTNIEPIDPTTVSIVNAGGNL